MTRPAGRVLRTSQANHPVPLLYSSPNTSSLPLPLALLLAPVARMKTMFSARPMGVDHSCSQCSYASSFSSSASHSSRSSGSSQALRRSMSGRRRTSGGIFIVSLPGGLVLMLLMLLLDGGRLDFEARVGAGERVAACDDACRRCRMPSRPIPSRCEHAYLIHLGGCVLQVPPMSPSTSNER